MKIVRLDPVEFEAPDSEEHLTIALENKKWKPGGAAFLEATNTSKLFDTYPKMPPAAEAFDEQPRKLKVEANLRKFASMTLGGSPTFYILANAWDNVDLIIETPSLYLRYHWYTTA